MKVSIYACKIVTKKKNLCKGFIKNVWNIIMIVTLYTELLVIFKNFRKQKIKNSNV
jgi:hypothetical protein